MDTKLTKRSYAVGIQEFEHFRTKGSVYIDKTSYVWKMVSADAKNFFLSRPRRFGKSLLISTLHAYFEGRKELFEGLAISQREKDWGKYPVVRLNLSAGKYYELDRMHSTIDNILDIEEKRWNVDVVNSELKNLQILTFRPDFEGVCGITQEELETQLLISLTVSPIYTTLGASAISR
jgi:hypothetical protein